jgi:hypothetical protein
MMREREAVMQRALQCFFFGECRYLCGTCFRYLARVASTGHMNPLASGVAFVLFDGTKCHEHCCANDEFPTIACDTSKAAILIGSWSEAPR